ncbi:hypothetical protein OI18_21720 [Flavihumibacter solisilvae]|uniref:Uncharacterized protein n=1 Tax=Flavihumibacter solisilvae TaxID=1349421 RepID=A0A0C1LAR1_9BACT|nr:hypothetical protein OI18_21720 [Flavihumibacter solisilvae]
MAATVIVIALLGFNVFIWVIAQGAGHNIPSRTNFIFGVRTVVLAGLAAFLITVKRKRANKRKDPE